MTGIDAATAMIERARHRAASYEGLHFQVGDLTHTPLPEGSLDVITAGYAYRNVPDLSEALTESRRLLRPGGTLCTLDFYRPAWPPWRRVFLGYLHVAGSAFGWWWHRAPVIYNYIATSIDAWVTIAEWERTLAAHGFEVTARRSHLGGGVAVHTARRR